MAAGSWFTCSVFIVWMKVISSAILPVWRMSEDAQVPDWPYCLNSQNGLTRGKELWPLDWAEMRPPLFLTEGGISWPCIRIRVGL